MQFGYSKVREYQGVQYTTTSIINDGYLYYVDSFISVSREFNDSSIIWATLKLRLMYNNVTNTWSSFKFWEFLVNPHTGEVHTCKKTLIRNANFMEAVWDIANVMGLDIAELAEYDSYNYDIHFEWPEDSFINDINQYSIHTY